MTQHTTNKVFVKRTFNCSARQLFRYLIEAHLIAQWFGPKQYSVEEVETDPVTGGKYSIILINPGKQKLHIQGQYLEVDEPFRLVYSLQYEGVSSAPPSSIVKFTIHNEDPEKSVLSLIQEFETMPADFEKRAEAWEHMFSEIDTLLAK